MGEISGEAAGVVESKKKGGGDGKGSASEVVLKIDLHCRGCASKILKCVRGFQGVVDVKVAKEANELTVEGKFDVARLQEKLQAKTKKKAEVVPVSQQKKKEKEKNEKSYNGDSEGGNGSSNTRDRKPKELPVITVVFKLGGMDCQGCISKINRFMGKTAGIHSFTIDKDKEVLTVKGALDAKVFAEKLKEKTRRSVEIVPQKKEKEGGGKNGGGVKFEGGKMEYYGPPQSQPGYWFMYGEPVHAPQLFSDENPNACSVM
ncbi:hypothetical protein MLD38_003496 [Melastoma candidum]|uniref:Uncharacterized protein n=1 Tax=Melastoma candidum TaxID=119954 RepID=A0ACB9S6M4_9MYRT|nr:hypothetical protein MLD38_003496 [Melastoma candidum]